MKFLKEAYIELKKVQWPTRREATRLTAYVIGVSLIVGSYVSSADYLFQQILSFIIE